MPKFQLPALQHRWTPVGVKALPTDIVVFAARQGMTSQPARIQWSIPAGNVASSTESQDQQQLHVCKWQDWNKMVLPMKGQSASSCGLSEQLSASVLHPTCSCRSGLQLYVQQTSPNLQTTIDTCMLCPSQHNPHHFGHRLTAFHVTAFDLRAASSHLPSSKPRASPSFPLSCKHPIQVS